jgi:hypothetical protein
MRHLESNSAIKRFADFGLAGKVFVVTGGARGLGLHLAEALVKAGGKGKFHFTHGSGRIFLY